MLRLTLKALQKIFWNYLKEFWGNRLIWNTWPHQRICCNLLKKRSLKNYHFLVCFSFKKKVVFYLLHTVECRQLFLSFALFYFAIGAMGESFSLRPTPTNYRLQVPEEEQARLIRQEKDYSLKLWKEEGFIPLGNGLMVKFISNTSDETAVSPGEQKVSVWYEIKSNEGLVLDDNLNKETPLEVEGDGYIPGMLLSLGFMCEGDNWSIYLPPGMAYGWRGTPGSDRPVGPWTPLIATLKIEKVTELRYLSKPCKAARENLERMALLGQRKMEILDRLSKEEAAQGTK
eukprot:PhF_6_TR32399/c0_g1_i1/m.48070/K03773/fklB; FKBP-type peptidyl-prolyl cis-trans isomerase FklB